MTLKGKECIEIADVLVYDYLCNIEHLRHAKPGTERIYVGKKAKDHTLTQDKINELIVKLTREGKIVTRLKGGDPVDPRVGFSALAEPGAQVGPDAPLAMVHAADEASADRAIAALQAAYELGDAPQPRPLVQERIGP